MNREQKLQGIKNRREKVRTYYQEMNNKEIAEILKVNPVTISSDLKVMNLKRKSVEIRKDFMDKKDDFSSYFLGLFMAEGWLIKNRCGNYTSIGIEMIDEQIMREVSEKINCNLRTRTRSGNRKKVYKIGFSGKPVQKIIEISDGYKDFNTYVMNLPINLKLSFLRGYFDGDGGISNIKNKKDRAVVGIVVARKSDEKIIDSILKETGIFYTKTSRQCKNEKIVDIRINRQHEVKKFGELIYKNASIFLNRKKEKFEIFENLKGKKTGKLKKSESHL